MTQYEMFLNCYVVLFFGFFYLIVDLILLLHIYKIPLFLWIYYYHCVSNFWFSLSLFPPQIVPVHIYALRIPPFRCLPLSPCLSPGYSEKLTGATVSFKTMHTGNTDAHHKHVKNNTVNTPSLDTSMSKYFF